MSERFLCGLPAKLDVLSWIFPRVGVASVVESGVMWGALGKNGPRR